MLTVLLVVIFHRAPIYRDHTIMHGYAPFLATNAQLYGWFLASELFAELFLSVGVQTDSLGIPRVLDLAEGEG
jgi:hypothetical protein